MFLDEEELQKLTGYQRSASQLTALNQMGIEYKMRPDNKIIVLRSHVERAMGGIVPQDISNAWQIDLETIR